MWEGVGEQKLVYIQLAVAGMRVGYTSLGVARTSRGKFTQDTGPTLEPGDTRSGGPLFSGRTGEARRRAVTAENIFTHAPHLLSP